MIDIELNDAALMAQLRLMIDPARGVRSSAVKAVAKLSQEARSAIARAIVALLAKDPTGRLARSFKIELVDPGKGVDVYAWVRSAMPYARIQDLGGVIRAKSKKLAIPVRGIPGAPRRGQGPREFARKLVFIPGHGGKGPYLAEEKKLRKGTLGPAEIIPRYLLRTSVRIPGVHYLDVAKAEVGSKTEEIVGNELAKKLTLLAVRGDRG